MPRKKCRWVYRPGTSDSHWAIACCDHSHKYLSMIPRSVPQVGIADFYNGRICPSCWGTIEMDYLALKKSEE